MTRTISDLYPLFLASGSVSIDSRTVQPNAMFIAIKGPTFNGNHYASEALSKGALYAIVDDPSMIPPNDRLSDSRYIVVDDGLTTLQELATYHRQQCSKVVVIGIGGSNGKTTSKELLHAALSKKWHVLATSGNLNNHIGVPLTLLQLTHTHDYAIIEMGANHASEYTILCNIAQPNMAVITNCGRDHLEGYGSFAGVLQSHQEVFDYIYANNGLMFTHSDDPHLLPMSKNHQTIYYGNNPTTLNTTSIHEFVTTPSIQMTATVVNKGTIHIKSALFGRYNATNILLTICMAQHLGLPFDMLSDGISAYIPENNRSQQFTWRQATVYLDAYNANPSSMTEFLTFIESTPKHNRILILGGMMELGQASAHEHKHIIDCLKSMTYDHLYLVGDTFQPFVDTLACEWAPTYTHVKDALNHRSLHDANIFVKGSRYYTLEKIFDRI